LDEYWGTDSAPEEPYRSREGSFTRRTISPRTYVYGKFVSKSIFVGETHSQEKSQPPENHSEINQRSESISKANEHDRDQQLKQHCVEGCLEPGIECSEERRDIPFLSSDIDEPGGSEEGSWIT
jgi:hypothetical protein